MLNTGTVIDTNAGRFEATAGSLGLVIQSSVNQGTTGRILAASANVFLASGATIAGGTLSSTGTGAVIVSNTATLDGTTNPVTNSGSLVLQDSSTLTLLGGVVNSRTLALHGNSYNTDLIVGSGTVTLSGGGSVALSSSTNNRIYGATAADRLVNVNDTIAGDGQFGAGQLTLVNAAAGTIDANAGAQLVLSTGANTVTNAGLLEATAGGGLVIVSHISNTGRILATGANVYLDGGSSITGGTISASGGGSFVVLGGNTGTLDATAGLTSSGPVTLNDSGTLDVLGTLTNQGTIGLGGSSYNTDLIAGTATTALTGGGAVALSDSGNNRIYGASGTNTLVDINNVIAGGGSIFQLASPVNQTTIDATGGAGILISGITNGIQNSGLLEATGTGGLALRGITVSNHTTAATDGVVSAAGGNVYLQSGAVIAGGTIASTGAAAIVVQGGNTGVLDGSATSLIDNGTVSVDDSGTLELLGTIVNHGTIGLFGNSYNTDLIAGSATTTLTGSGTLALSDSGNNRVYGAAQADTLVNLDNTITGGGQFTVRSPPAVPAASTRSPTTAARCRARRSTSRRTSPTWPASRSTSWRRRLRPRRWRRWRASRPGRTCSRCLTGDFDTLRSG